MTAKGKINASSVQTGDRILIETRSNGTVRPSSTKTGEFVSVARVTGKTFRAAQGPYEARGKYVVTTSAGSFEAAAIQTMFLAPEDPAGVKRAHAEAVAEDRARELEEHETRARELAHAEALAGDLTLHSQDCKVKSISSDEAEEPTMNAQAETPAPATGSTVVSLLEKVWDRIRADHPDLPEIVIVTGSGLVGASKWGHFRPDGWKDGEGRKHELFLAGEALAKGAHQVLQTMLHEGAHTLAKIRDIKDTSRQHRYHNSHFRTLAAEMGLEHRGSSPDSTHGFSFVTLTEATKARYADLLAELETEIRLTCHLPLWLGGAAEGDSDGDDKGGEKITAPKDKDGENKPQSGPVKAVCECEEPNIIRLSKKLLARQVVTCEECESAFRPA